jgi:sulfate transport system permease protein
MSARLLARDEVPGGRDKLLAALRSDDRGRREAAILGLGWAGEARAVPARKRRSVAQWVVLSAVLGYLALILVVPIVTLVVETLRAGIGVVFTDLLSPAALQSLLRTLSLAAIAVVFNGLFGIAAAIVLVRHRFFGRDVLDALVDLSFAVSPVMVGLAFLLLVGRDGWLAPILQALNVKVAFAYPGLVIATVFVTLPFTVREVSYVLAEVGDDEEKVAATLGASQWKTFWRVTLPNIRHALTLGTTLTVARALGEFGALLVLGGAIAGRTHTATTFIYTASEERKDAAAFGMALVLAVSSMLLLFLLERLKQRSDAS